ncbi:MAG TPA: hypothetical protein VK140_07465, partial [Ktedonobacteraceae bacterium]|nr:hypothetical protein [Ktedonobacteraceae bacterium]
SSFFAFVRNAPPPRATQASKVPAPNPAPHPPLRITTILLVNLVLVERVFPTPILGAINRAPTDLRRRCAAAMLAVRG